MSEQVILNLRQAVKDEIKKADLDDKEYGYSIARDLFVNMRLNDIKRYFGSNEVVLKRIADGKVPFEEAEEAVLKWREEKEGESK